MSKGKEDKLINFYEHMDKDLKNKTKRDKNFKIIKSNLAQ